MMDKTQANQPFIHTLVVVLYCTKTKQTEQKKVWFETPPSSVLDVKKQIQKQLSIPVCVQTLSYDGQKLLDNIKLKRLMVRDSDSFHVQFLSTGHCAEITEICDWMTSVLNAIKQRASDLNRVIVLGIRQRLIVNLGSYFSPWEDPLGITYADKLYFADIDGVQVIMDLYACLLQQSWTQLNRNLKYLEYQILRVLWRFSETFALRRLLVQHKVIPMCTQSLLRVKLQEGKQIRDLDTSKDPYEKSLLVQTISNSIGVLFNLIELPECRTEIASNKNVLDQVSCYSLDPSLPSSSPQMVSSFFINLAFTPENHKYIADSIYIHRLLRACGKLKACQDPESLLLEYTTLLFLAQVCLESPECIERDWHRIITDMLETFLRSTDYKTIMDEEVKHGYDDSIFVPYIKLAYIPSAPSRDSQLQLLSLQFIIFALQNMLGREGQIEFLRNEGSLDYVACMPHVVPSSLKPLAEDLVKIVASASDCPLGPLKLSTLVKAQLAKIHFGLEQVMSLSTRDIVVKAFCGQ